MKILLKTTLSAIFVLFSSVSFSAQYNHVDHNDPQEIFEENSYDTLHCGSASIQYCISLSNIRNITGQWCRDKVRDVTDGVTSFGNYYHLVRGQDIHVVSATDNGSTSNNYSVDLSYSCVGYKHTGPQDG